MEVLWPVVAWWLALTVIGWSAVPLAHRLFATLPDRGLAFARPLGLLAVGYAYWLGATAGAVPNTRAGAVFVVLALAALGGWVAVQDRQELSAFLRRKRNLVLGYEWLFFVLLAGWALYRAHNPAIETAGGEKYMEMAFIDAILASPRFPPNDPWLSGFAISYYYFGYILAALLIKITGLIPYVAFNLVVPMTMAMSLVGAFGLGYNLVALTRGATRVGRLLGGGLTGGLLIFVSSLEGALEVAYLRGWGAPYIWNWLDIKNLTVGPGSCPDQAVGFNTGGWVPLRHIWWWRGSRVIHDNCGEVIHEFPFFSFMLADAHPHVVALPFALAILGLALAVLGGALERGGDRPLWSPRWLALPLIVGSLGFLNAWDLPTYAAILVAAYGLRALLRWGSPVVLGDADQGLLGVAAVGVGWLAWRAAPALVGRLNGPPAEEQSGLASLAVAVAVLAALAALALWLWRRAEDGDAASRWVVDVVRFAAWLLVLAIAFYLPFHVGFRSQASGIGVVHVRSRMAQWLVHFGPVFFLAVSLVVVRLGVVVRRRGGLRMAWLALVAAALAVVFVATVPPLSGTLGGLAVTAWVLALVVAAGVVATLEGWLAALAPPDRAEPDAVDVTDSSPVPALPARMPVAATFALVCATVGLLMPLGTEFVFVRDLFNSRMNSVFKLYFQAWTLMSVAGGYAVFALWRALPRWGFGLWAVPATVLLVAGLAYPAAATYSRTRRPPGQPLTLDGLSWWRVAHPDDLAAAEWLKANVAGTPVILEAHGGGYEHNGRISMATGLPTVLGWEGHEHQWRGTRDEIDPRKADVETMYTTGDEVQLRALLAKYRVRYVVLGNSERGKYQLSDRDVLRFERLLEPVFQSGDVRIFANR